MSNLGFQSVYRMFSLSPEVTCERVFLPDPPALESLKKTGRPLTSFESGQPLTAFHAVAFSLSFENDYLNVLTMLRCAKIPLLSCERSPRAPLVIAGGVAVFLNPEPLADIFDLFILGEAEEVIEEFLRPLRACQKRRNQEKPPLSDFKGIPGVYIPSAYKITYDGRGLIQEVKPDEGYPEKVACRVTEDLSRFPATSCFVTPATEFAGMALVEVSRGCPRGCRFCAAGSVYQPFRVRDIAPLLDEIKPLISMRAKIGILGAAVSDYPWLTDLLKAVIARGGQVSVSSLRADALTDDIVSCLKQCNHKTFTIAPEAGTERLRKVIAKKLSAEEIFRAVQILSRHRIPAIRLYFMIGLPTEELEDIRAIVQLAKEIKHAYFKEAKSEKWLNHIQLTISPFVPKPWTPFQWHPFDQVRSLKQKIKIITQGLKKERKILVSYDLPKWGYVQALLSRGDRRVGRVLIKALENGGDWSRTFRETDSNPDFYVYREREADEIFSWDFVKHEVKKKQLWKEYQKALGKFG